MRASLLAATDPPYGITYDPAWRNQAGRAGPIYKGCRTNAPDPTLDSGNGNFARFDVQRRRPAELRTEFIRKRGISFACKALIRTVESEQRNPDVQLGKMDVKVEAGICGSQIC